MASVARTLVDRLRRPEYTGENRCLPCTVFNSVLAVALSGGAVVGGRAVAPVWAARLGGVAVLTGSAVTIYFRGYLVPGTPAITRTYFPDWVLRLFDKEEGREPGPREGAEVDAVALLRRASVVVPCETEDDLCLTEEFRRAWRERVREYRETAEDRGELAPMLGVAADRVSFDEHGDAFVAYLDGDLIGRWESRAAFTADVAAATELRAAVDEWRALGPRERSEILQRLRVFLDRCPACDGPVAMSRETVDSCCRRIEVVALECEDCGARVFEARPSGE